MKRWILIPMALVALGVGSIAIFARSERAARRAPESAASAALTEELAQLKREVQSLKGASAAREVRYVVEKTVAPPAPAETAAEEQRSPEQRARDAADALAARFTGEPVDGAWAPGATRQIRDAIAGVAGVRLLEAECASSLCRVVLGSDTLDAQRELARSVRGLPPFRTGSFYDYDSQSVPPRTTVYALRPGASFQDGATR